MMYLLDIGEATGMMADDVVATLVSLDMMTERDFRLVSFYLWHPRITITLITATTLVSCNYSNVRI